MEKINASSQVIQDENNQLFEKTGGFSQYSFHEKDEKNEENVNKEDEMNEKKYILKPDRIKVNNDNSPYYLSNLQSSKYQKFNFKNDGLSNISLSSFPQLKPLMNPKMISETIDEIFRNEKSTKN